MTQSATYKKVNHQADYRSKIQDTTRKLDSPSSPVSSHQSSIAIQVNNSVHTNETFTSSTSSSLTDSLMSEYPVNHSTVERKISMAAEKSTFDTTTPIVLLTKPHISTARIQIQPPTQHTSTPKTRRKFPSVPSKCLEEEEDEELIYVNDDNDFRENQFIYRSSNSHEVDDEDESESCLSYSKPMIPHREILLSSPTQTNQDLGTKLRSDSHRNGIEKASPVPVRKLSSALEIDQSTMRFQRQNTNDNLPHIPSQSSNYERTQALSSHRSPPPPPPPPLPPPPAALAQSFLQHQQAHSQEDLQSYPRQRTLPVSNFMIEVGALLVVFIICMVLVLAIREDETKLRTTMQIVYSYIYVVSIIWMIWCTFDIIKFRRQWADLTLNAQDHDEYMYMTERHSQNMFYFPDIHNTGGLFMRIGAGLLCMGGLILTVIEIAKTVAKIGSEELSSRATSSTATNSSSAAMITTLITYIFRFIFHCVQFSFLFRYGNLVINRYHLIAKIGLIHLVIANFCTWFEAIVIETLEQLHSSTDTQSTTTDPANVTHSTTFRTIITMSNDTPSNVSSFYLLNALRAADTTGVTGSNKTTLESLYELESAVAIYLYPCIIEYSLISLTIFFIMWRNVGNNEKRSFLRFGDRHVFTVNCARASRGLLVGGIIFLLTIITLIPTYLFEEYSAPVSHITGMALLVVSLFTVCLSYFHTTKLFYDHDAHVDAFDQVLILITTVGDFGYSFFSLFASLFLVQSKSELPIGLEISIELLAIGQAFLQTSFIMDTLKRRTTTKQESRERPGRETITALLLVNLAIWMHDSFSARKARLNPSQTEYYDISTWAIIQAFTLPLSIFYRFHSSVCLADIWQEVYHDNGSNDGTRSDGKNRMLRSMTMHSGHEN